MPKDRYEDQELDNRYHLQRLLDTGSFGAVYEARDRKLGRIVAVKILFEQNETAFRKEAKLAVQFEHPNVVKVFDYGADADLNVGYIVMEFLKGRRLDQIVASCSGRVPISMIAQFADEIGSALQLAHDRQLIHRDLKPRNVMLVDDGTSQERFVLLDLGLASQTNSTSTLRNQTLDGALSPHYASPEQFGQGAVDSRSDIYSFGTILFELVTGEIPFPREQLLGLMMAICNEAPPRMSDVAPDRDVPEELEEVVQHCLQKDPAARPASVREVRETMLRVLSPGSSKISPHTQSFARGDTDHEGFVVGSSPTPGTGTMLPPGDAAAAADLAQRPSWKQSARRGSLPSQPEWKSAQRRGSPLLFALLLIPVILLLIWFLVPGDLQSLDQMERPVSSGKLIMADELRIRSGGSAALQAYIQLPPMTEPHEELELRIVEQPEWLAVQLPDSPPVAEMFDIRISAAAALRPMSGDFILLVRSGEWSEQKRIQIRVDPPVTLNLPSGHTADMESPIIRSAIDGRSFYQKILREVDESTDVSFILVDPPRDPAAGRPVAPFYIMETKVPNGLFKIFWSQPSAVDSSQSSAAAEAIWMQGAPAGSMQLTADQHPQLPVVSVTAAQAHRFSLWLTTGYGHLPSVEQWNLASGLLHQRLDLQDTRSLNPDGPFLGSWVPGQTEVFVDRRRLGPGPVGAALHDVTVTGVREMAGNVQELTESLINGGRAGDVTATEESRSLLRVLLRGRSFLSATPLTWEEIEESTGVPDAIGYTETDPTVGFRVVLETAH